MYTGHVIVKSYNYERKSISKFKKFNDKLYNYSWKAQFMSGIIMPLMNFIGNLSYVLICIVGEMCIRDRLVTAGSVIVTIFASFLIARVAMAFGKDLREKVFTRVESYSLNEIDKFGSASLITRTTNDVTQIQNVFIMMRMLVMAVMMGIGGIIMAVTRDAKLSIIFAVIPVSYTHLDVYKRQVLRFRRERAKMLSALSNLKNETVPFVVIIIVFSPERLSFENS